MLDSGEIAGEQLLRFIDRIERLEEEKAEVATQVREVYAEAKSQGFDPKIMRQIVRLRKRDPNEIEEEEAILHLYKQALGMS
ncbi:MAG: DUF2312 domain-containing protein [Magnetococcales bacterium]|nr:DUF2312 domain-containing protein [Magnetococcales bacterium]MBF0416348.1 DUF2312 domain-containing protein [Magnetococcales bacterium]MBF0420618.1 DUF2312 domain-containing protein [Magnetococcales bacterium]